MNKFQVPASTAETLRGTDFACEGVFGDLPRSFLSKFDSANGNNLTCRQKSSTSKSLSSVSSYQGKRNSSAASQQNYKKQKTGGNANQGVFQWAKMSPKGGGPPAGNSRGKGKGQKQS